jgi:hypothetical protein
MPPTEVVNYAALKALNPANSGVAFVQGYTAEGDGGQGIFEWVAGSSLPDNDGTVLASTFSPPPDGRWIRQLDVRGVVHPEWFGFKGDGTDADYTRLEACFTALQDTSVFPQPVRIVLQARTYYLKGKRYQTADQKYQVRTFYLRAGQTLEGQGIDKTILASRTEDGDADVVIPAVMQYINSADGAVVRDLTIDCGFNQSSHQRTRCAISFYSAGVLVERVKAVNFGVGIVDSSTKCPECFVIGLTSTSAGAALGTIRECVITQPGTQPDPGYAIAEITCLLVSGGGKDPNGNPVLGNGGAIVGNHLLGIPWEKSTSPTAQPSCPHLITVCSCHGTLIADNEAISCDGVGVYIVSWTDSDVVVRNNRLLGMNTGVMVGVFSAEIHASYSLIPYHIRTRIEDNLIVVGRTSAPIENNTFAGIFLVSDETIDTNVRLQGIQMSRNVIRANKLSLGGGDYIYPRGIYLSVATVAGPSGPVLNYQAITISDNLLEVPDFSVQDVYQSNWYTNWPGNAYENALVFFPGYHYQDQNTLIFAQLRIHNNRNLAGVDLRLKATHTFYLPGKTIFNYWGIGTNRTARFRAPAFNGRAGVFYDEFIGQLPRSALGWVDASSSGAEVTTPASGDLDPAHPGIAKAIVHQGTGTFVPARLKYGSTTLSLQGNLTHSFEFAVRRSHRIDVSSEDYECRIGLLGEGDDGVFFNIKYDELWDYIAGRSAKNFYRAWAINGAARANFWLTSDEDLPSPPSPHFFGWHRCRIDVVPSPTPGVSLEARFFYQGILLGIARNAGTSNPVPTDALYFGFRVQKVGAGTTSQDRFLLVDYFQHQVY